MRTHWASSGMRRAVWGLQRTTDVGFALQRATCAGFKGRGPMFEFNSAPIRPWFEASHVDLAPWHSQSIAPFALTMGRGHGIGLDCKLKAGDGGRWFGLVTGDTLDCSSWLPSRLVAGRSLPVQSIASFAASASRARVALSFLTMGTPTKGPPPWKPRRKQPAARLHRASCCPRPTPAPAPVDLPRSSGSRLKLA